MNKWQDRCVSELGLCLMPWLAWTNTRDGKVGRKLRRKPATTWASSPTSLVITSLLELPVFRLTFSLWLSQFSSMVSTFPNNPHAHAVTWASLHFAHIAVDYSGICFSANKCEGNKRIQTFVAWMVKMLLSEQQPTLWYNYFVAQKCSKSKNRGENRQFQTHLRSSQSWPFPSNILEKEILMTLVKNK